MNVHQSQRGWRRRTLTWEIRNARWRWRRCNDNDGVYCPSFWFNWINDTQRLDSNLFRALEMVSAEIQQRRNSSSDREMMSIETISICFSPFHISRVHIQSKINYFSLQHSAESSFVEWIRIRVDFNSISFNTFSEIRLTWCMFIMYGPLRLLQPLPGLQWQRQISAFVVWAEDFNERKLNII